MIGMAKFLFHKSAQFAIGLYRGSRRRVKKHNALIYMDLCKCKKTNIIAINQFDNFYIFNIFFTNDLQSLGMIYELSN